MNLFKQGNIVTVTDSFGEFRTGIVIRQYKNFVLINLGKYKECFYPQNITLIKKANTTFQNKKKYKYKKEIA